MVSRGSVSDWKSRDHSLFICYAPTDTPRYAMSVVVEHGTFGARAAAPIAKDVMTFLFDPATAMDSLLAMEKGWGGTPQQRMAAKYQSYAAANGAAVPPVAPTGQASEAAAAEAATPVPSAAPPPRPEPGAAASPSPAAPPTTPAAVPSGEAAPQARPAG
jgi:penicillin-binding protein 2